MTRPLAIHALPGMGADHRMYPAPWATLPGFVAHDWPRHAGERSLHDVARRLVDQCGIRDGDIIVGSSLGGMVACELTKLRAIPMIVLVGSALHPREFHRGLAPLLALAPVVPFRPAQAIARRCDGPLLQMFSGVDPAFMRQMCRAMFAWPGGAAPATRVFRIHGRRDPIIPPPPRADLLLDARHALALSHPAACVAFVREILAQPGAA